MPSLPLCAVGEFFLNKVWNALLCFIICSLILPLCTLTNRGLRKRGEKRDRSGRITQGALQICSAGPVQQSKEGREANRAKRKDGKVAKTWRGVINNHLAGVAPIEEGEKTSRGRIWECPRKIFQCSPHCSNSKPANHAMLGFTLGWFLHPAGKLGTLGCCKFPHPASHSISLSPHALFFFSFFLSLSLLHVQDRNNMEEISCTQPRGYGGLGGRARGRQRGGGWAGVAKFKNISGCRTLGWATALQRHTFDFSYFGCFFHIWGLPYKLMTKEVIQTRQEKTRWLHHRHFHFVSKAAFLQNQEVLMKLFMIFRPQVSQGNPGYHDPATQPHRHQATQSTLPRLSLAAVTLAVLSGKTNRTKVMFPQWSSFYLKLPGNCSKWAILLKQRTAKSLKKRRHRWINTRPSDASQHSGYAIWQIID